MITTSSTTTTNSLGTNESTAESNSKIDKDEFLKILLTQLQNQDPLDPMDNNEFTQQLTLFSSLEELMNLNSKFTDLIAGFNSLTSTEALNLIGKEIEVTGDTFEVSDSQEVELMFDLESAAEEVVIDIYDEDGKLVKTVELKDYEEGKNSFIWNGLDKQGIKVPAGEYSFKVTASGADGVAVAATEKVKATVTSVIYDEGLIYLEAAGKRYNLNEVTKVS
ncbi:MAG: flagellar hook assembly protein FlgD [Nitrospinota bacterium]